MKRDVELLFELGMIRHLPRQWVRFGGINFANLADHHFRVAWTAMLIANREDADVDIEKILKMALVHDIAESRTNDVDYIARQYTERNEELAMKDILEDTSMQEEFIALFEEYEERKSLESKIVKDADTLDIDLEVQEQEANGVKIKGWLYYRDHVAKHHLYTKTAKELYKQIKVADPHGWHVNSPRNRFKGGDYKKS